MKVGKMTAIILSLFMGKSNKRVASFILALTVLITCIGVENITYASEEKTNLTIYFIDNSEEKWVENDNAQMQLVDNTNGHDCYNMTKIDDITWSVSVPSTAYNITFNRISPDKSIQWNSWSTGGRDSNNAYYADGAEYGHWDYKEEIKENYFHAGDIVYLDLGNLISWEQATAQFYVNFADITKADFDGKKITFPSDNESVDPKLYDYQVADHIYAYVVTTADAGNNILRFWRGNETTLWNYTITLKYSDYYSGLNCIKVSDWNNSGELTNVDYEPDYSVDSDGDGLANYFEAIIGTDKRNKDTDGDSLNDYYELNEVESNPLVFDSITPGISDGDVDSDGDGLSNAVEFIYSSDPKKVDTDSDKLNDYDEVHTYNTKPTDPDTDDDGIEDYDEIALGLNPNKKDTDDNGIEDSEEFIEQIINDDRYDSSLLEDNIAIPNITSISAKNNVNTHINISEYTGGLKGDERAYVGKVIEISGSEINSGKIEFTLNSSYTLKEYTFGETVTNGLIICYNNGENTTPLESSFDEETRTISTIIGGSGIYFVLDVMSWLNSMGIDSNTFESEETNELSMAITDFDGDDTEKLTNEYDDVILSNVKIRGQVDIIFVVDTTGSMSGYISNVKNNINSFVNEISAAGITPNFALVEYRDITCDGTDSTKVKKNSDSLNWFNNVTNFKNEISKLTVSGGGDALETTIDALEMARELDLRPSSQKFIIVVTDAGYKVDNNYGIESMDEIIALLVEDEINVSVVSSSSCKLTYKNLYEKTGGVFATVNSNFKDELLKIADLINEETNSGCWIALNGLIPQIVKLKEAPSLTSISDTDDDELPDNKELADVTPTKYINIAPYLYLLGLPKDYSKEVIPVYEFNSNPTKKDTDGDDIRDKVDIEPKKANDYAGIIKTYINDELADMSTIKETTDDFLICTTSIADILSNAGITEINDGKEMLNVQGYFDDWYLYVINNSSPTFGLFKMREQEFDSDDNNDPGVTISFIDFDISKLNDALYSGDTSSALYKEIDDVVYSGNKHCSTIQEYFSNVASDGSYIIAEAYADKIAELSGNNISFPTALVTIYADIAEIDEILDSVIYDSYSYSILYKKKSSLSRVPNRLTKCNEDAGKNFIDFTNHKIKVSDINALTYNEQIAILASFTADSSYNMFAAEVKAHSDYLVNWISKFKDWPIVGGFVEDKWYLRAIRADMAIGEEYESGFFDEYYDEDGKMVKEQIEYHGEK